MAKVSITDIQVSVDSTEISVFLILDLDRVVFGENGRYRSSIQCAERAFRSSMATKSISKILANFRETITLGNRPHNTSIHLSLILKE